MDFTLLLKNILNRFRDKVVHLLVYFSEQSELGLVYRPQGSLQGSKERKIYSVTE